MWSLLLVSVALAAPSAPVSKSGAPKSGASPAPQVPAWETKLYAQPLVGGSAFSSGGTVTTAVSLGAEAGLRYWQTRRKTPRWRGVARIAGNYVLASGDSSGMEARLGNFIGPAWKSVGLQTGPDLFWNQYQYGAIELDPTVGLAWPLTATAWTQAFDVWAGVEPAWLSNPDRRVDWSTQDVPGFGHEFTYRGGLGLDFGKVGLSLGYSYRITAGGGQHGLSAGIQL